MARLGVPAELVIVSTTGDRDRTSAIHAIGGNGVFVKEVQEALRRGDADVAVHSAKDLPAVTPEDLVIGAVPERLASFERKIAMLRTYLRGDVVRRGDVASRIEWLHLMPGLPPVPLELVPSGPRVAAIAARYADRISFAVGADPEYVAGFIAAALPGIEPALRSGLWSARRTGCWVAHDVARADRASASG